MHHTFRIAARIALTSLIMAAAACGEDGGEDDASGSAGVEGDKGSARDASKEYKGSGPKQSPAGRPLHTVCEGWMSCTEYFSSDPSFSVSRDVGGWCTTTDERCPSTDIAGTCLKTVTAALGGKYDEMEVFEMDTSGNFKRSCEMEGGTWLVGPR